MTEKLRHRATSRGLIPLIAVAIAVSVGASTAEAQSISNLTIVKNGTNSADQLTASGDMKTQTNSTVAIQGTPTATSFATRYAFLVGNDRDGGFQLLGNTNTQTLNSSYTISFQVTAPGAYRLNVSSLLSAEVNRRDDGGGSAGGDLNALNGSFTGGTLQSGALGLPGTSSIGNGSGNANVVVSRSGSAVIQGVSNGSPVTHTLTFTWSNVCRSIAAILGSSGEECAVKGGVSSSITGYTAGVYPGTPARTQANDGHFITVTLDSLCGNGTIDAGLEQCDLSGANGAGSTCCTSSCQFRPAGQTCRGLDDVCDQVEVCTGSAALCPADIAAPSTQSCRAEASVCDLEDFCDGTSHACPPDAPAPASRVCRASSDDCDVDDFCDGSSFTCGADNVAPTTTLCRPVSGVCDAQDFCDGTNKPCPADDVLPSSVLCRAAGGDCDVDDFCDGVAPDCGTDNREPNTVLCRPLADDCDIEDFCDGGVSCPADVTKPDVDSDGLCDEQDNCPDTADPTFVDDDGDGRGNVCDACTNVEPVDIVNPNILVKRLNTAPGDDTIKFTGTVTVPTTPTIDPIANGLRFRMEDPDGEPVIDVTIPGGAYNNALRVGWKATAAGWKYKNVGRIVPLVNGIGSITLTKDKVVAGRIKFLITGKKGNYAVVPSDVPLKVSFVVDAPFAQTGQCGESLLTSLECVFDSGPTQMQCENPN